jgi:ubiquinol-cytochrome c reductase cytochrome c subunit
MAPILRFLGAYVAAAAALGRWATAPLRRVLVPRTESLSGWSRAQRSLLAGPVVVVSLGALAFSLFAGFGGVSGASESLVSTNPVDIAAGQTLFNIHCSSCHGANGVGSSRAPELINVGAAASDFYLTTGRMPLNAPDEEALRHHPFFNPGQIRQIDAYVNALPEINGVKSSGPTIPTVLPLCTGAAALNPPAVATAEAQGRSDCVTLSFGNQTFTLNCAQCHQIAGRGGLLAKGNVIPSLQNATLVQTVEAMRVGPQPMPQFGPGQLTYDQVSAIAHYVHYLQSPNHDGGLTISGFGPVAEGFVGIIAGLGLLLFASRLIGTRR